MAGTATAHLRERLAIRQPVAEGLVKLLSPVSARPERLIVRTVQVGALAHLSALVALERLPVNYGGSFLLAAAGAGLVLLAYHVRSLHETSPAALEPAVEALPPVEMPAVAPQDLTPPRITLNDTPFFRELQLEIQSQRLVEIADAATRARSQAERRSQTWATLLAQVSHELRTPLNAVIGFSDVMTSEMFGPMGHPRYREYADHIRDSGRALLKSTEDTLALTELLADPSVAAGSQGADLPRLAADAWAMHRPVAEARAITLTLDIEVGTEVLGESRLIRQILVNLFAEALSRAADGAEMTLAARGQGDLVEIEIAATGAVTRRSPGEASLPLCLARALLELQDAFLVEYPETAGRWRAATMLSRAAQQDFFPAGRSAVCAC